MIKILILEDDIKLSRQWQKILSKEYEVFVTHGASQALLVFENNEIDICIIDLLIKNDGYVLNDGGITFLGKIRIEILTTDKKVSIIGVSGSGNDGIGIDAEAHLKMLGADRYLAKPFTDEELLSEVKALLQ